MTQLWFWLCGQGCQQGSQGAGARESLAEDLVDPGVAHAFPLAASMAGQMSHYGSVEHHEPVLGQLPAGISSNRHHYVVSVTERRNLLAPFGRCRGRTLGNIVA